MVNPGPMVIAADTKAIAHSKELRDEARTGCQFLSAAPTVSRCSHGETTSQPPPYCHTNPRNAYLSHCKNMGIYIYIHCHHGFHNMDNVRMVSQCLFFPAPRLQVSYPDVDMQLEPSLEKQFIQHLTCNKGHSHNVLCVGYHIYHVPDRHDQTCNLPFSSVKTAMFKRKARRS